LSILTTQEHPNDFIGNEISNLISQEGVLSGELFLNVIENHNNQTNTSLINSFETLFLKDGIVSMNVPRKYVPNDPTIFDPILTKATYVSGKYAKYIDTLKIRIDGIYVGGEKQIILKYTLTG